jgi:hypothetical protein
MKQYHSVIITICIGLLLSANACAQNIYILGKINRPDIQVIKDMTSTIQNNTGANKLVFHFPDSRTFVYKPKKSNSALLLEIELTNYVERSLELRAPSEEEINAQKKQLIINSKRPVITLDLSVTDRLEPGSGKRSKSTYVLILKQKKPEVSVNALATNGTFTSRITGIASSKNGIREVLIRVDETAWETALGVSRWTFRPDQYFIRSLEIKAVDMYNIESDIVMIKNITRRNIADPAVTYMYPTRQKNMVSKCINNDGPSFEFKVATDPAIERDKLSLVVEDQRGYIRFESLLSDITEESIRIKPKNGRLEYCIFIGYSALSFKSPCAINEGENLYYSFRYSGSEEKVTMPDKVLIHFSSFDSGFRYDHCDCD